MSHPTLPPDRPRWAVTTVRTIQAALAVLALAVLGLTAVARPAPDPDPASSWRVLLVPDTTLVRPSYTPVPAGPPCPAEPPEGGRR